MANFVFSFIGQGSPFGVGGCHHATPLRLPQFYGRVQETSGGGEAESLIA